MFELRSSLPKEIVTSGQLLYFQLNLFISRTFFLLECDFYYQSNNTEVIARFPASGPFGEVGAGHGDLPLKRIFVKNLSGNFIQEMFVFSTFSPHL